MRKMFWNLAQTLPLDRTSGIGDDFSVSVFYVKAYRVYSGAGYNTVAEGEGRRLNKSWKF